ncbi:MAG: putative metal-binding motif-containing protein, partial [Patescibacteria group bacterium]
MAISKIKLGGLTIVATMLFILPLHTSATVKFGSVKVVKTEKPAVQTTVAKPANTTQPAAKADKKTADKVNTKINKANKNDVVPPPPAPLTLTVSGVTMFVDSDNDGYYRYIGSSGMLMSLFPMGDCDDSNPAIHPNATEIWYDGVDQNCDRKNDYDQDGDGYDINGNPVPKIGGISRLFTLLKRKQQTNIDIDCNDTNADVHPNQSECADGIDNNCNGSIDEGNAQPVGTWYADLDNDGYGNPALTTVSCGQPTGYVANNTDCDDNDRNKNPGETEVCDGQDNNCDGLTDDSTASDAITYYRDADNDNYGNAST